MSNEPNVPAQSGNKTLVGKMAERFGVDPMKLWETLKLTAFKQRNGQPPTNEQMMALLIVADQYGLNPFTKEIYAYPDNNNGIVPVVGVDGWSRIINNHPQYDGMEFHFSDKTETMPNAKSCPEWCKCVIYRKDRTRPTIVPEYLDEVFRNLTYVNPWKTHTKRMLRHKAMIQAARIAFGYAGIYDEDEASRIIEGQVQASNKQSIEFDSDSTTLTPPNEQDQIMIDLAQVDFEGMGYVSVEQQPELPVKQSLAMNTSSEDSVMQTPFGMIASKDANMIRQIIDFTADTGAWDTTKDSFNERYKDATLEYALSELNIAFNLAFSDQK